MTSWATLPALRLALALALGIGLSAFDLDGLALAGTLAVCGTVFVAIPVSPAQTPQFRGFGVWLLAIALGTLAGVRSAPARQVADLSDVDAYVAEIESIDQRGEWAKADARLLRVRGPERQWGASGSRVRLMLSPDVARDGLGPGAIVLAKARLMLPSPPLNPGGFDYRRFLLERGIGHQAFARASDLTTLRGAPEARWVGKLRAHLTARLRAGKGDASAFGVARALVLGDRGGVDDDTREAYVKTGAVHVLAVSGLHTGIVAAILLWLLAPLRRRGVAGRVTALLALWAGLAVYALLTGGAPSVQRSAVMFGMLFAGTTLREDGNALNSLGASAVVLLLFDPRLLFSLGFQLSYCAVAGIIAFHPTIKGWMSSGNPLVDRAADLLAVSLAATLATAPLTVYYFHQFPWTFVVSGLLAVPLVTLAIPLLLGGLAVDAVGLATGGSAAWALAPGYVAVELCNRFLAALASLPGGLSEGLWPTGRTTAITLVAVAVLGAFCIRRRPRLSLVAAGLFCLGGVSIITDVLSRRGHTSVITYGLAHSPATDVVGGGSYVEVEEAGGDGSVRAVDDEARRVLRTARVSRDLRRAPVVASRFSVFTGPDRSIIAYAAGGLRWLVVHEDLQILAPEGPAVDWVILGGGGETNPTAVAEAFPHGDVLLVDYPPPWLEDAWSQLGRRVHVLPRSGAYEVAVGDGDGDGVKSK